MIKYPEVRVVLPGGGSQIMKTLDALAKAREYGLDLIEVSSNSKPPVCKIMDSGKYKYELEKKIKEKMKHQKSSHIKEIRLRPKTGEHDYQTKLKHIIEFLSKKNKVRISIYFKGREVTHSELGMEMVERLKKDLEKYAELDNVPKLEGRFINLIFRPLSENKKKMLLKAKIENSEKK